MTFTEMFFLSTAENRILLQGVVKNKSGLPTFFQVLEELNVAFLRVELLHLTAALRVPKALVVIVCLGPIQALQSKHIDLLATG